jgi:hypothetical protein
VHLEHPAAARLAHAGGGREGGGREGGGREGGGREGGGRGAVEHEVVVVAAAEAQLPSSASMRAPSGAGAVKSNGVPRTSRSSPVGISPAPTGV